MQTNLTFRVTFMTVFACLTVVFTFSNCKKNELVGEDAVLIQQPIRANNFIQNDFRVVEGMLFFDSFEDFSSVLNHIASKEHAPLMLHEIEGWENRIDFTSMRSAFTTLAEKYYSSSTEDKEKIQRTNDHLLFEDENAVYPRINDWALLTLLNKEGKVMIDGDIYHFTENFQIILAREGYSQKAYELALEIGVENVMQGVFVFKEWQSKPFQGSLKSCNNDQSRGCSSPQIQDRRVKADFGVQTLTSLNRGSAGFGEFESATVRDRYVANIYAQKRNFFGSWVSNNTQISFLIGIEISSPIRGSAASGTGWTSSSLVQQINVSWDAFSPGSITVPFPPSGNLVTNSTLTYLTGGAEDEPIDSFCFACCPWDCATKTEADIP